jgi:hypothetical protein
MVSISAYFRQVEANFLMSFRVDQQRDGSSLRMDANRFVRTMEIVY